ncbi:MAG: hypothetical protein ACFFCS_26035 [Candidatus Hodarchaeota archaeon]
MEIEIDESGSTPNHEWKDAPLIYKIIIGILVVIGSLTIIVIPFIIFAFARNKYKKKTRNVFNVIFFTTATFFLVVGSILSIIIFKSFDPSLFQLGAVPSEFWEYLESNTIMIIALLSTSFLSAVFINRLSWNMLVYEESLFQREQPSQWVRLWYIFRWKNKRTCLKSGNETLMKVKNAATVLALFSLLKIILTILIVLSNELFDYEFKIIDIYEYLLIEDPDFLNSVLPVDFAVAILYSAITGGIIIISNLMMWFYIGRLFSYQAQHFWRRGNRRWIWMKFFGYVVSIYSFIPLIISLFTTDHFFGIVGTLVATIISSICWVVLIIQFKKDPNNLVLDPKNLEYKLRKGLLNTKDGGFKDPAGKKDIMKRVCFGFFVSTIVGISFANGAIWFPATFQYARFTEFYEWGFYFFLGLLMVAGPVILLFFLRNVYVRRVLMLYLVIVLLLISGEVANLFPAELDLASLIYGPIFNGRVGYTAYIDRVGNGSRPGHVALVLLTAISSFAALFVLKRKALPIKIGTKKHGRWSSIKNLRRFIYGIKRNRLTKANLALVFFLSVIGGVAFTIEPPEVVTLHRPAGHQMQISFWGGVNRPDSTLQILGDNNINLHAWIGSGTDSEDFDRITHAASFGIKVVKYLGMPTDMAEAAEKIAEVEYIMDFWDASGLRNNPFIGFVTDEEKMVGVEYYNETWYQEAIEAVHDLTDYINSRGYKYFNTEYLMTIGDLLDGDHDLGINNRVPFDPTWNMSHFDWMVYRNERAIEYDEPYEYFTYEWARYIKHFMLEIGGEEFFSKASMSIGVTSYSMPLYRPPRGLEEFLLDVKICHAMGISEIKIFALSSFLEIWGNEGLQRLVDEVNNYTEVSFQYRRRATFLGNLKGVENPTGSVFGFMYQDAWLDEWIGFIPSAWLAIIIGLSVLSAFFKFREKKRKLTEDGKDKRDRLDYVLVACRIAMFLLMFMSVFLLINGFWYPEFFEWNVEELY